MATSPATPRSDSPILPSFPRRLSSATTTPTLPRIAEQPQIQAPPRPQCQAHAQTFLYSPSIPSPNEAPEAQDGNYTFLDSSSSSSSISSSTSPSSNNNETSLLREKFPSCLSLQHLGFQEDGNDNENDNSDDWNEGWEISTPPAQGIERVANESSGPYGRVPTPEIPLIREGEFRYYPKATPHLGGRGEDDGDDGSLKLARRRLVKKSETGGTGFGKWLRGVLGKMRLGGRL